MNTYRDEAVDALVEAAGKQPKNEEVGECAGAVPVVPQGAVRTCDNCRVSQGCAERKDRDPAFSNEACKMHSITVVETTQPAKPASPFADDEAILTALKTARGLLVEHHASSVSRVAPGQFCPVCHKDGDESEINSIWKAIQLLEKRIENNKPATSDAAWSAWSAWATSDAARAAAWSAEMDARDAARDAALAAASAAEMAASAAARDAAWAAASVAAWAAQNEWLIKNVEL